MLVKKMEKGYPHCITPRYQTEILLKGKYREKAQRKRTNTSTTDSSKKGLKKGWVHSSGKMVKRTLDNLRKARLMGGAYINGMKDNNMMANGAMGRCTGLGNLHLMMGEFMQGNSCRIRKKAKGN